MPPPTRLTSIFMASADRQRLLRSPQLLGVPAAPQRSRPRLGSRFLSSISTLNNCILLVVVVTGFGRSTRDVPLVAITTGRDAREIFRVYPHVYRLLSTLRNHTQILGELNMAISNRPSAIKETDDGTIIEFQRTMYAFDDLCLIGTLFYSSDFISFRTKYLCDLRFVTRG